MVAMQMYEQNNFFFYCILEKEWDICNEFHPIYY